MGASMKCEKNSLALLSCKRTKAFSKTRADEAFALPSFPDAATTDISSSKSWDHGSKFEYPDGVELLKQTMLQHESMFKEQLYELHRLYQVQQRLMEESNRQGSASHPHSGSPSSNSSLICNPDVCILKGQTHCWDASDVTQVNVGQQLSFLPSQLNVGSDANKRHLYRDHSWDVVHASCYRPIIDLECPADESMENELEEKAEKPLTIGMLFHGQSTPSRKRWPTLDTSSLTGKDPTGMKTLTGYHSEKGIRMHGSFWNRLEDCAMPQMPSQMAVPLFPAGPGRIHESSSAKVDTGCTRPPATSLFGVNLLDEYICQQKHLPRLQGTHEEGRTKRSQSVGMEGHQWSKIGASKLPHWLLQGLPTSAAASPIAPGMQTVTSRQHHTIPFILDKFDERNSDLVSEERSSVREFSCLWPTACGAKPELVDSFLKVPLAKSSQGCLPGAVTTDMAVQSYHKALLQDFGVNESLPSFLESGDQRGAGVIPLNLTSHSSFPGINRQSSLLDTHAAGALLLPGLSTRGTSSEVPPSLWLQQKVSLAQTLPPSVSELPCEGFMNPYGSVSVVGNRVFDKMTTQADNDFESKGPLPELSSKREIFGFMSTACYHQPTPGLDLNMKDILESSTRLERLSSLEDVGPAKDRGDVGLKLDLNVELTEKVLDGCCTSDMLVGTNDETECISSSRLLVPIMVSDKRQTLHNSPSVIGIPCVSNASTSSPMRIFPFARCREASYVGEGKLPAEACAMVGSQQLTGSGFFSTLLSSFTNVQGYAKDQTDFDNGNNNNTAMHVTEADAAEILLHMGLDMECQTAIDDGGTSLQSLAGLVDSFAESDNLGSVPMDSMSTHLRVMETKLESAECLQEIGAHQGKVLDSFELSALSLKPINPDTETLSTQPVGRCDRLEECPVPLNLRRRSLRRGRSAKDFQKEMLPSITLLSRQEITDDLQIIEGLVRSTTEVMAKCSVSSKEAVIVPRSMPGFNLSKGPGNKGKGSKSCEGKQNGLLRVCSWGESTRCKRMRRQRGQRLCLPPSV